MHRPVGIVLIMRARDESPAGAAGPHLNVGPEDH